MTRRAQTESRAEAHTIVGRTDSTPINSHSLFVIPQTKVSRVAQVFPDRTASLQQTFQVTGGANVT
jgi:hypothetical protein